METSSGSRYLPPVGEVVEVVSGGPREGGDELQEGEEEWISERQAD